MLEQQVQGKIIKVLNSQGGTSKAGREWIKQEFVIETEAQFNPLVCLTAFGEEKVKMLENHNIGDVVTVSYNLSSKEFNGRFYTTANVWQIAKSNGNSDKFEKVETNDLPF
tara:strand:- start:182 stop:514 length:333 start_codon:yes stop_codon:yes gene_type:complete